MKATRCTNKAYIYKFMRRMFWKHCSTITLCQELLRNFLVNKYHLGNLFANIHWLPTSKKKSSKRIFVSWFYNTEEESNIFGILPRPYYFFFNYTDTHRKNTGPYFYVKFIKKKNWFIFVTNCDRQWKYKDHT